MHLKKIVLRNFRCFRHMEIDLHPRLTVLVAENGGGKTSVLDAIAIGLSGLLPYLSTANQRLSGIGIKDTDFLIEDVRKNDIPSRCDTTQVEMVSTSGLHWDVWKGSAKGRKPERAIGRKDLSNLGKSILESFNSSQPEILPVFGYYGAGRGWLPVPQRLRGTKVDYLQPTAALIDALQPASDFKEMLNWFDLEESAELRANKGCRLEDWEDSAILAPVRAVIEIILGNKYKNPQFNKLHKFVVDTEDKPGQLQVSQLSQGYQSMLALAMDYARRLALANRHLSLEDIETTFDNYAEQWTLEGNGPSFLAPSLCVPSIMLVDEIDLHLHPTWQQRVLGDLMRAFPCTQFVVTTHSPQVLTTLRGENIRMLLQEEDYVWQAATPVKSPLAQDPGDALANVMNTHPKPEIAGVTQLLRKYEELARAGRALSPEAQELKRNLDVKGYQFNEADKALFAFLAKKAEGGNK